MLLITDRNIDIWYNEYLTQYNRTKKYVKSRGGKIRDIDPASKKIFKTDFLSEMQDNPKLSGTKLAQKMAKDELYELSWKTAKKQAEAHVKEFGGEINLNLIQKYRTNAFKVGEVNLWDSVSERRKELKNEGFKSSKINVIISQEFFGSP